MSLTSIIRDRPDIREGLRARVVRPPIQFGAIQAPPLTDHYGIVGTAFDYLFRFYLQRINTTAEASAWVAEAGVELIGASDLIYDLDRCQISRTANRQKRKAKKYLEDAKRAHRTYLSTGVVEDELLVAALRLAHLDVAYRVGPDRIDWTGLNGRDERDMADLRELLASVPESRFKAKKLCLLNPTFGDASRLVGGADADVLIDDCLIDIKNTKEPHVDSRDFLQLVGYYLLHGYAGISCGSPRTRSHPVKSLGIYYSRYGLLWKFPIEEALSRDSVQETAKWFFDSVYKSKAIRARCLRTFQGPLASCLGSRAVKIAKRKRRPGLSK